MTFFPSFFRLLLEYRFSSKTGPTMVPKSSQNSFKIAPYHTTFPYVQKVWFWMTLLWKTYIFGSTFGPIFFLKSTKESMKKEIASSACQKPFFYGFWNHFWEAKGVQRTAWFFKIGHSVREVPTKLTPELNCLIMSVCDVLHHSKVDSVKTL